MVRLRRCCVCSEYQNIVISCCRRCEKLQKADGRRERESKTSSTAAYAINNVILVIKRNGDNLNLNLALVNCYIFKFIYNTYSYNKFAYIFSHSLQVESQRTRAQLIVAPICRFGSAQSTSIVCSTVGQTLRRTGVACHNKSTSSDVKRRLQHRQRQRQRLRVRLRRRRCRL